MPLGKKYHGYTSYETWLVYTWILDNDTVRLASLKRLESIIERVRSENVVIDRFATEVKGLILGFVIEHNVEDNPTINLKNDLVFSTINEVNWVEIAEKLIDSMEKYEF